VSAHKVIDSHVHIAGPGDLHPGDLYWNERFTRGVGFKALKALKGLSRRELNDDFMRNEVRRQLAGAPHVDGAVVLALDNVYLPDGSYRGPGPPNTGEVMTTLYVSNDYVDGLRQASAAGGKKLLLGISVHPFRDDALQELERFRGTAALCKWLPSAQIIDFSDPAGEPKLEGFFRKLADLRLPLLFHTGYETSIPSAREEAERLNNPVFIETALDLGVTVILAHGGCSYFDVLFDQENVVQTVINLFQKQRGEKQEWRLYADISAVFSPFRKRRILDELFDSIPPGQLVYGSDYPNPARGRHEFFLWPFLEYRGVNLIEHNYRITENWLRYFAEKYFPEYDHSRIFTNFHRLLEDLGRGGLA
jgi:predicted TIM-barrel fold metal-dependent hydrolase